MFMRSASNLSKTTVLSLLKIQSRFFASKNILIYFIQKIS